MSSSGGGGEMVVCSNTSQLSAEERRRVEEERDRFYNRPRPAVRAPLAHTLGAEQVWLHSQHVLPTMQRALQVLKQAALALHLNGKTDPRLPCDAPHPEPEKHQLVGKLGSDAIKATITLLADNVLTAEVVVKHPKAPGGFYRGVAQPDVQWKLQQLQDLGNHVARAGAQLVEAVSRGESGEGASRMLRAALDGAHRDLVAARAAVQLPRKRSLLELCHFPPTRRFAPPLPQDVLVSLYVSNCRLVLASYQMLRGQQQQSLVVCQADCHLPQLATVLTHLNTALALLAKTTRFLDGATPRVY